MSIKPVTETEADSFFNEIDRITELYTTTGPSNDLSEKLIRAAILTNLLEKITITLAMELRKANTTDEVQSVVNVYLHDNRIGLPRGMQGPMICLATKDEEENKTEESRKETLAIERPSEAKPDNEQQINATTKGNRKGDAKRRVGPPEARVRSVPKENW